MLQNNAAKLGHGAYSQQATKIISAKSLAAGCQIRMTKYHYHLI